MSKPNWFFRLEQANMCGIAGVIDITARQDVSTVLLKRMADVLVHRGPDEQGYFQKPGIGLASRRLSIVDVADGHQPMFNEAKDVCAVFNGEIFDHAEIRADLLSRGHVVRTHCDTELLTHLWEDHREVFLKRLNGQFALALFDETRREVLLARDRFGICPLYWTVTKQFGSERLLFASEIKALLATGLIDAKPNRRGIDCVFNFLAVPAPETCFEGVYQLPPGKFLKIALGRAGERASLSERTYWSMDFPDHGEETTGQDTKLLVDEFEGVLQGAVSRRLRADVPIAACLSGGVDSSLVTAMSNAEYGKPLDTFTSKVLLEQLDEASKASKVSDHLGSSHFIAPCGTEDIVGNYQKLLVSTEAPVVDTASAALLLLVRKIHQENYKVVVCGEGADELLAGYPWFKLDQIFSRVGSATAGTVDASLRYLGRQWLGFDEAGSRYIEECNAAGGGRNAFHYFYTWLNVSRSRFYSSDMLDQLRDYNPYTNMAPDLERVRHWHPMHRSIYWGMRIHLAGHLLSLKGDRVAMSQSVEMRYPFLDNEVFDFLAKLHPDWKLRGLKDKYLLRLVAERWLPKEVAWRRKAMFRAPLNSFFLESRLPYVDQLLSEESLRKTGYFDPLAVEKWRQGYARVPNLIDKRSAVELGLVAVLATQLWHHTYIEPVLADLPDWRSVCNSDGAPPISIRDDATCRRQTA
jgi:asparagine synthase (glutamine-hydrolysing)